VLGGWNITAAMFSEVGQPARGGGAAFIARPSFIRKDGGMRLISARWTLTDQASGHSNSSKATRKELPFRPSINLTPCDVELSQLLHYSTNSCRDFIASFVRMGILYAIAGCFRHWMDAAPLNIRSKDSSRTDTTT